MLRQWFFNISVIMVVMAIPLPGIGDEIPKEKFPNVYQPPTTRNPAGCSEIEYRSRINRDKDGKRVKKRNREYTSQFHPGSGDYCVYIENVPFRARCVRRNDVGEVFPQGPWIKFDKVRKREFKKLCPELRKLWRHERRHKREANKP